MKDTTEDLTEPGDAAALKTFLSYPKSVALFAHHHRHCAARL